MLCGLYLGLTLQSRLTHNLQIDLPVKPPQFCHYRGPVNSISLFVCLLEIVSLYIVLVLLEFIV